MPDPAPVPHHRTLLDLEQCAAARRAPETCRHARALGVVHLLGLDIGHRRLPLHQLAFRLHRLGEVALDDLAQPLRDLLHGKDIAHGTGRCGRARHGGVQRLVEVLHHPMPAASAHGDHARGTVVQRAREDDGDHTPGMVPGGRPEQHVDGRSVAVLVRPVGEKHRVAKDHEVLAGDGHHHHSRLQGIALPCRPGRQGAGAVEDRRESARASRGEVQDDQHAPGEVGRQVSHQLTQCLDSSGGRADDHDRRWGGGGHDSPSSHGAEPCL